MSLYAIRGSFVQWRCSFLRICFQEFVVAIDTIGLVLYQCDEGEVMHVHLWCGLERCCT